MFWIRMRRVLITCWCFNCCRAVLTPSQGLFSFSLCPANEQARGAARAGRGQTQDSWPKLAKGVFHTIWCHSKQYIGVASRGGGTGCSGIGWALVIRWWAIALCITCFVHIFIVIIILFSVLINCLYLNPQASVFSFLSPIPERERGGWVNGCVVLSCWPG